MDWFALHCRSCTESMVAAKLQDAGIDAYFPHRIVVSPRRKREMEVPVFTGYIFAFFDREHRQAVAQTHQVVRVLGAGTNPICIAAAEIEAIKIMVAAPVPIEHCEFLVVGDRVKVRWGPLTGLEGYVTRARNKKPRVVVSITVLQQSRCVEVERDALEYIGRAKAA